MFGPDERLEPSPFDRILQIDRIQIDAEPERTLGKFCQQWRHDGSAKLARNRYGRRGIANLRDTIVIVVAIPSKVQPGTASDIDDRERPAFCGLINKNECGQQKRAAAHFVCLRDAGLEKRDQLCLMGENKAAERWI